MTGTKARKKSSRERLSIDLDAHPDVRDALIEAEAALGYGRTELVIEALRAKLPMVVERLAKERQEKLSKFREKYGAEKSFPKPKGKVA